MSSDVDQQSASLSGNNTIRLQALSLISDCYKYQMDLTTNGIIVNDAIKYVQGKLDHLTNQEKKLLHDINEREDAEAAEAEGTGELNSSPELEEQHTHNGVF